MRLLRERIVDDQEKEKIIKFINASADIIHANNFDLLYEIWPLTNSKLTDLLLLKSGVNVLKYLSYIPSRFAIDLPISSIDIPSNINSIGWLAFCRCINLVDVKLHDGLKEIKSNAFSNCKSLTNITIPGSVKKIGNGAFLGCDSLKQVYIEEGVEELELETFKFCPDLEILYLPKSLNRIGDYLLLGNARAVIYYNGSRDEWTKIEGSIFIPDYIKIIYKG